MIDPTRLPGLRRLAPQQYEVLAYLAVGAWNTVFGMGLYALGYRLCGRTVHYLVLAVPVNILAITNAFLCYKLLVFRTKGHWLAEYLRCYIVYGGGTLAGMLLLWLLVRFLRFDPVAANILGTGIVVVASFFGHKYFSFGRKTVPDGKRK